VTRGPPSGDRLALSIGTNNVSLKPFYAVTAYPSQRIETSWRVHSLWNAVNTSPAYSQDVS
jgi:hypothetical protein